MPVVSRSALIPLLVCILAATAGCSGGLLSDGSDANGGTETGTTADGAQSGTADADDGKPTFLGTHEQRLREAGNVTVNSTYVERLPDRNQMTQAVSREARVDFDTGRTFTVIHSRSGTPVEQYRTETGATFARSTEGLEPTYRGPEETPDVNASERVRLLPVDPETLERQGRGTVDGVTGTVYTAESAGNAAEDGYERYFRHNVTEFSLTFVVVDDSGHVSYARVDLTTVRRGTPLSVSQRIRYTDVGSTTVPEPDWLDEAKAAATESGSSGEGTATDGG